MPKYQEFYRGVLVRSPGLLHKSVAVTPSLGVAMYFDPTLKQKPVLELCKLRMGLDRSIMQSWDDDQKLAMWDPDERDDFFDQANRRGIIHQFRSSRAEHKASVIAALNLLAGGTVQNLHMSISGKIEPKNRELDADFAKEMVEMTYNDSFNQANAIFETVHTGNLSPTALAYGIEAVMRAMDRADIWKHPTELFQSIMLSEKQRNEALMDTLKDGSGYAKAIRDESAEWIQKELYFRKGFRDFDVLAVEPEASFLTKAVYGDFGGEGKREPNEFSGDYPVLAELWSSSSTCESRMNSIGAYQNYGFNVGPSNFRKFDMIRQRIENGQPWVGESRMYDIPVFSEQLGFAAKKPLTLLDATPPDLPADLAEIRLETLQSRPGAEAVVAELHEILVAEKEQRSVNPSVFRDASLALPPATMHIDAMTLTALEDRFEAHKAGLEAISSQEFASKEEEYRFQDLTLEVNELGYWCEQHPDFEPSQEDDLKLG